MENINRGSFDVRKVSNGFIVRVYACEGQLIRREVAESRRKLRELLEDWIWVGVPASPSVSLGIGEE